MAPFRELLRTKDHKLYWDAIRDSPFKELKNILQKIEEWLKIFEINRVTCLSTDYSKTGIEYFLFKRHCQCQTELDPDCGENLSKIILAGSRFTNNIVSLLSWRRGSSNIYIWIRILQEVYMGMTRLTGHSGPLVTNIFRSSPWKHKNPRQFVFTEKSLMYRFRMKQVPGNLYAVPDCTSRYPMLPEHSKATTINIIQQINRNMLALIIAAYVYDSKLWSITLDKIVATAATDEECWTRATYIQDGFLKSHHEIPLKIW